MTSTRITGNELSRYLATEIMYYGFSVKQGTMSQIDEEKHLAYAELVRVCNYKESSEAGYEVDDLKARVVVRKIGVFSIEEAEQIRNELDKAIRFSEFINKQNIKVDYK